MQSNLVSAQVLRNQLEQECKLYLQYLELLDQEKNSITQFKADKVELFTEKRDQLFAGIQAALAKRAELVKKMSGSEKIRLTEAIRSKFKGPEAKQLMLLAKRLKELTMRLKKQSMEFNQIVNFGLNVVNGTLSIYMSATQNVNRGYSKAGLIKESFNPQGDRHSGVIKEA
jgi:hypothetical protein